MAKKRKGILNDNGSSTNETIYDKNISDFLNGEYMDYVMYVLANRAIPSMVDGLRTGARKILHAALTGPFKNGKPDKLTSLVGDTFRISLYPHGDASLSNTARHAGSPMSAATTVTETASCWTMGRNVSVCRVFPIRCCAGGSR